MAAQAPAILRPSGSGRSSASPAAAGRCSGARSHVEIRAAALLEAQNSLSRNVAHGHRQRSVGALRGWSQMSAKLHDPLQSGVTATVFAPRSSTSAAERASARASRTAMCRPRAMMWCCCTRSADSGNIGLAHPTPGGPAGRRVRQYQS